LNNFNKHTVTQDTVLKRISLSKNSYDTKNNLLNEKTPIVQLNKKQLSTKTPNNRVYLMNTILVSGE